MIRIIEHEIEPRTFGRNPADSPTARASRLASRQAGGPAIRPLRFRAPPSVVQRPVRTTNGIALVIAAAILVVTLAFFAYAAKTERHAPVPAGAWEIGRALAMGGAS